MAANYKVPSLPKEDSNYKLWKSESKVQQFAYHLLERLVRLH